MKGIITLVLKLHLQKKNHNIWNTFRFRYLIAGFESASLQYKKVSVFYRKRYFRHSCALHLLKKGYISQ